MKFAHLSDLHFCAKNLVESGRCMRHAVDRILEECVDAVIISGDSTDHALDVHAPAVQALAYELRRLADHAPVLMLQGTFSHEPPGTLNIFRLLGGKYAIHVADTIGQVGLTQDGTWVQADGWSFEEVPAGLKAIFSCVPTVNKAQIAAIVGAAAAGEATGAAISQVLAGFSVVNAVAQSQGLATVVVGHGTVNGCTTEHDVPMAGLDHEFSTGALFSAKARAVMLGHIHKHQRWDQAGQVIAYAGSLGRFHFGEYGEKGFLLWDVSAQQASCELVPLPARKTLQVEFQGAPDMEELRALAREVAGCDVRIRWTVSEEEAVGVDRAGIEALFQQGGEVKIEGRVLPVVRSRAPGMSSESSLLGKLTRWAQCAGVETSGLEDRLQALGETVEEAIVSMVVGNATVLAAPIGADGSEEILEAA